MDTTPQNQVPAEQIRQSVQMKNAVINEYNLLLKYTSDCSFSKSEIENLLKLFKKYDHNKSGKLNFHDILVLLQEYGLACDAVCKERIFKEIEDRNTTKLDFQTTLFIVRVCKDYNVQTAHKEEEIHQSEYRIEDLKKLVDAFVALGGDPEASGYISKQRLVDILFTEFDLSFDMDDLLEQLEVQNDLLDFGQFKRLFKGDVKTMKRNSSLLSLISARTQNSSKSGSSISTVKIRMRDFEQYLKKLEEEGKEELSSQFSPGKRQI